MRKLQTKKALTKQRDDASLDDPVVQEVRKARSKLWKQGGETIEGFLNLTSEIADEVRSRMSVQKGKRRRTK